MLGLECIGYGQWRPRASAPPRFVRFALCQRGHRACKRFVRFALCQRRHRACKREGEDGAKHEHDTRTAARRVTEAEVRSHGHAVAGIIEICDPRGRSQPGFFSVVPLCVTCLRFGGDNTTTNNNVLWNVLRGRSQVFGCMLFLLSNSPSKQSKRKM